MIPADQPIADPESEVALFRVYMLRYKLSALMFVAAIALLAAG